MKTLFYILMTPAIVFLALAQWIGALLAIPGIIVGSILHSQSIKEEYKLFCKYFIK